VAKIMFMICAIRFVSTAGVFTTSAHASVANFAGVGFVSVTGQPVEEAVNAARRTIGSGNQFDSKERWYAFHNTLLMKGLGIQHSNQSE